MPLGKLAPGLSAQLVVGVALLANLFDGMVAVEGGLGTPSGILFNDFPDRIADPTELDDHFYSEMLLRLPNGLLCYKPLETAPQIEPRIGHQKINFGKKLKNIALKVMRRISF